MDSSFSTNQIILFIGAAQGLILAFLLLSVRKNNNQANRILASIIITFCINIIIHTLSDHSENQLGHHHSIVIAVIFLLFGPLFYFYVKTLTLKNFTIAKKDVVHFIPFFISLMASMPFYFLLKAGSESHEIFSIISGLVIFHVISYMLWNVKLLIDHSKRIKDSFSSLEKINLHWLNFLMIGFSITWLVALYFDLFLEISGNWDYVWMVVSVLLYVIGYMGLKNPQIFSGDIEVFLAGSKRQKKKYEKSTLTGEMAEKYLERLQNFMISDKPYLNSDITLNELASQLSISIHHLSQVINENLNMNFFEFINSYRVEEAKKLFADPHKNHLNIAAIGFEAGFNSNSSFVSVFKSQTGMPPSQYKKSLTE